jgi:hypothetical protein
MWGRGPAQRKNNKKNKKKILLSKVFLIRAEVSEACKRNERVSLKVLSSKMDPAEIRFIR